jgi:hypothetical protein
LLRFRRKHSTSFAVDRTEPGLANTDRKSSKRHFLTNAH